MSLLPQLRLMFTCILKHQGHVFQRVVNTKLTGFEDCEPERVIRRCFFLRLLDPFGLAGLLWLWLRLQRGVRGLEVISIHLWNHHADRTCFMGCGLFSAFDYKP